jgi:hypothetical protein
MTETLESKTAIKLESGRVWLIDFKDEMLTLYSNEANYNSDTAIGSMAFGEMKVIIKAAKLMG